MKHDKILLNELLKFDDLSNVKIRFNLSPRGGKKLLDVFQDKDTEHLLSSHYWNYNSKSYKEGQITVGFLRLNSENLWLLFHVSKVTKDLNLYNEPAYEYESLLEYEKYIGRLIVKFKNKSQTMIRLATSVMDQCEVVQLLPDTFDNDIFPGYDKVRISWSEMSRVIKKEGWKTALENQKGVYLTTDTSNGKMYVGSAYGENMILGRWRSYVRTGHGGNVELKKVTFAHIKQHFEYSILDIFKAKTDDDTILERESWWKSVLKTREFGYNQN